MKFQINMNDVEVVAFRRSRGNGGQHNNKASTAIRMLHKPTGIRVESCKERSLTANYKSALKAIEERISGLIADKKLALKRDAYAAKPEAAFASQDRTYRLVGTRSVEDHRTGFHSTNTGSILDGDIDAMLMASIYEARRKSIQVK